MTRPSSTPEALERIEAKLDRLERALTPLAPLGILVAEAPAAISTAVDALDTMVAGEQAQLEDRLRSAVRLVERITRPRTLATLHTALDLLDSLPALAATAADTLDDLAAPARGGLHARIEAAGALLGRMTEPSLLALLQRGLDQLQRARARAQAGDERRLGLLGLLRALRDPDTQRAVGLVMSVLQEIGRDLDPSDRPEPRALPT